MKVIHKTFIIFGIQCTFVREFDLTSLRNVLTFHFLLNGKRYDIWFEESSKSDFENLSKKDAKKYLAMIMNQIVRGNT